MLPNARKITRSRRGKWHGFSSRPACHGRSIGVTLNLGFVVAEVVYGLAANSALTVHLVMPEPPTNGKFLHEVSHELNEHFEIGHATVQIEHGDEECHQAPAEVV